MFTGFWCKLAFLIPSCKHSLLSLRGSLQTSLCKYVYAQNDFIYILHIFFFFFYIFSIIKRFFPFFFTAKFFFSRVSIISTSMANVFIGSRQSLTVFQLSFPPHTFPSVTDNLVNVFSHFFITVTPASHFPPAAFKRSSFIIFSPLSQTFQLALDNLKMFPYTLKLSLFLTTFPHILYVSSQTSFNICSLV